MIIGLTGGIGAGKSVVGAMLRALGALVIDTDKVGHQVYRPGSEGWRRIADTFGAGVLAADGTIDRQRLGAIVFADEQQRRRLNGIIHPLIFAGITSRIAAAQAGGFTGHIVLEAPILLEAKGTGMVDRIWVVAASAADVRTRLLASRDLTVDKIEARVASQLADAERRKHADLVIENDRDLTMLRARVEAAWRTLAAP